MAEFSKLYITTAGQSLIAKIIAGTATNVDFTKVCTSSTNTYTEDGCASLVSLTNIKQSSLISRKVVTSDTAVQFDAVFINTEVTEGYNICALGLYASDPDDGEILYGVCLETSGSAYMPPYNGLTNSSFIAHIVTTVGNADSVSLSVDPSATALASDIEDLQAQIDDLEGYVGYNDEDIYGLEVDFVNKTFTRLAGAASLNAGGDFDGIEPWGGRRRCNLTDDGVVVAYYGDAGFSTTGALTQTVTVDDVEYPAGTKVQVMVEQPRFYYKVVPLSLEKYDVDGSTVGYHMRKARYYISPTKKKGFKLHPAFIENGHENTKIYLAAFEGCLYDTDAGAYIKDDSQVMDASADLLSSIAYAKPASGVSQNLTRANCRTLCENRGAGWEQAYAATISASQLLMIIEYGALNMQSAIGNGVVSITDDEESNLSEQTGATVNLGNASGTAETTNGYTAVSYRGEENFWGNIWSWIDGININNPSDWTTESSGEVSDYGSAYVADHAFADNTSESPYEDTGIHPTWGYGYVNAFGYSETCDWLFLPSELGGSSSLPVGDYLYNRGANWRVARLGGSWYIGSNAGPFYWHLDASSAARSRNLGARSVFIPTKANS